MNDNVPTVAAVVELTTTVGMLVAPKLATAELPEGALPPLQLDPLAQFVSAGLADQVCACAAGRALATASAIELRRSQRRPSREMAVLPERGAVMCFKVDTPCKEDCSRPMVKSR